MLGGSALSGMLFWISVKVMGFIIHDRVVKLDLKIVTILF